MTITCVITDDEPMARKGLQSYVERVDFLSLTGVCEDAIQLNTLLKTQQPDFMDQLISAARIGRSLGIHLIGFIGDLKPASQSDRYFRL